MNDSKSVFAIKDYGKISLHLKEMMDSKKSPETTLPEFLTLASR